MAKRSDGVVVDGIVDAVISWLPVIALAIVVIFVSIFGLRAYLARNPDSSAQQVVDLLGSVPVVGETAAGWVSGGSGGSVAPAAPTVATSASGIKALSREEAVALFKKRYAEVVCDGRAGCGPSKEQVGAFGVAYSAFLNEDPRGAYISAEDFMVSSAERLSSAGVSPEAYSQVMGVVSDTLASGGASVEELRLIVTRAEAINRSLVPEEQNMTLASPEDLVPQTPPVREVVCVVPGTYLLLEPTVREVHPGGNCAWYPDNPSGYQLGRWTTVVVGSHGWGLLTPYNPPTPTIVSEPRYELACITRFNRRPYRVEARVGYKAQGQVCAFSPAGEYSDAVWTKVQVGAEIPWLGGIAFLPQPRGGGDLRTLAIPPTPTPVGIKPFSTPFGGEPSYAPTPEP